MNFIVRTVLPIQRLLDSTRAIDFLAPLLIRIYLVPVLWMAGTKKLYSFEDTAAWFGNPDWGLGLPMPEVMAALATGSEVLGAILLAIGLGVRWISVPLMITMIVAAVTTHWQNGWLSPKVLVYLRLNAPSVPLNA